MEFSKFKAAVAAQFERMKKHDLFRTQVEKDTLWATYLNSFPKGSNPIYRERTEHDCNCCKQFIRAVGNVVVVVDGKMESIWDINIPAELAYQAVADAMSVLVKSKPIEDIFLHYERTAGTDKNFQQLLDGVKTWNHFFVNIPADFVAKGADIASILAEQRDIRNVFHRSLTEITDDAIDTVLELIAQRSLYRGEEQKFAVMEFRKMKAQFNKLPPEARDIFSWTQTKGTPQSVTKIRNTAIGTLLVDLSEGKDLEAAVAAFEAKVAPTNYKRPTALVTKGMIEQAKKTVESLGLTSALERRYAVMSDITVNNVIFADRSARRVMGDVFDDLASGVVQAQKSFDKVEEIPVERFLNEILPRADSIEVMFENRHTGNLVSLIAPVDPTAGQLFKWSNNFSWAYNGDVTDSIKERVKAAGGSIVGDLCCRLAWEYTDDLDFHMHEPGGDHIYFNNRRIESRCGGVLDLDANGLDGIRTDPAENIVYADRRQMLEGVYILSVDNYNRRSDGLGFEVEVEFDGQTHCFAYERVLRTGETIEVCKIKYSKKDGFSITGTLPLSTTSRAVWGIKTQVFHKVGVVMFSPNHWDGYGVGNKHYFFMLDGCAADAPARGFFNEYLKEEFTPHRKVFEIVGAKMRVADAEHQLSGLGFSSTQKNTLICRVKGSFTRIIKVVF